MQCNSQERRSCVRRFDKEQVNHAELTRRIGGVDSRVRLAHEKESALELGKGKDGLRSVAPINGLGSYHVGATVVLCRTHDT